MSKKWEYLDPTETARAFPSRMFLRWERAPDRTITYILTPDEFATPATVWGTVPSRARAERIVACVNACEGIDDPAAALAEVQVILHELRGYCLLGLLEGSHADHSASRLSRALALLGGAR